MSKAGAIIKYLVAETNKTLLNGQDYIEFISPNLPGKHKTSRFMSESPLTGYDRKSFGTAFILPYSR
jgi:hypothetical protein